MPFTPSDTLVLDTARLRVWQQDDDYAYSRELVPAQKSLMDWLGERFDQFWESVFGTAFYQEYSSLMWILVGVILILAILLFLFYKHPELFMRSGRQAPLEYEVTEDTIYGVDFEREIARAMERKDYREAMRLTYLQTLKMLSDHQLIDWQPFKTPTQYTHEWKNRDFRQITNLFVRVRYGGFEATEQMLKDIHTCKMSVDNSVSNLKSAKGGDDEK